MNKLSQITLPTVKDGCASQISTSTQLVTILSEKKFLILMPLLWLIGFIMIFKLLKLPFNIKLFIGLFLVVELVLFGYFYFNYPYAKTHISACN